MQDIILIIIGVGAFGYVGWRFYKILTHKPSPGDKCAGCSGCALKEKMDCNNGNKKIL